jgi:hypothetical protein
LLAIDTSRNHCLNAKAEAGVAVKVGMWNHFFGQLVLGERVFHYLSVRRNISASSILKHDCLGIPPEEAVVEVGMEEWKGISYYHLAMKSVLEIDMSNPSERWGQS